MFFFSGQLIIMNKIIFIFSITLFFISTAEAQDIISCNAVKNGTYSLDNSLFSNTKYVIHRSDDKQIEIDKKGNRFIFNVEWINACHYKLTLQEIIPSSRKNRFKGSYEMIIVEILKVDEGGYKQKSSTIIDGHLFSRTTRLTKENSTAYPYLKKYLNQ